MKLILPVAGKGTRLRPHTFTKPKSLVKVAGKTVLRHVMDSMSPLNIEEFIVITDENGHIIKEYLERHYPDLNFSYQVQEELLGPAHAVWLAAPRIKEGDEILVVFNDTLFITDLAKISQLSLGLDGLIYSKEVEQYQRFGVNIMKDGKIVDMVEKPTEPVSKLAQVGLYYLKDGPLFMNYIKKTIDEKLTVNGEYYLPNVFKLMIKDGMKLGAPEIEEWLDCGKPDTLLETNRRLLQRGPSNHQCNQLESNVIIPPVSIHPSAQIKRSIIGPFVTISRDCKIKESIITDSVINPNTILENTILTQSLIGDSVYLRGQFQRLNIGDNSTVDLSGRQ